MIARPYRLSLLALVCVIYFTVSGGAFGVEPGRGCGSRLGRLVDYGNAKRTRDTP